MTGKPLTCVDLFCGIGGFRVAAEDLGLSCVFSCDIDETCRQTYHRNFGEWPASDIMGVSSDAVPDHDILMAGFPCQPFSIMGHRRGFDDTRGTLFFEIARILETKRPRAFVLENVKLLAGHNRGRTIARIMSVLKGIGYAADWRVLNALRFGLPQKRERIFIVGFDGGGSAFRWPLESVSLAALVDILEPNPPRSFYASERIVSLRKSKHTPQCSPSIWHENKAGHISSYPFSCALRAGASYNYLLVDGVRRLTPREMCRLQGFPDSFVPVGNITTVRRHLGNAVPVPVVRAVLREVLAALPDASQPSRRSHSYARPSATQDRGEVQPTLPLE